MPTLPLQLSGPPKRRITYLTNANDGARTPITANVWYNLGGSFVIPAGTWILKYGCPANIANSSTAQLTVVRTTLSTGATTESHPDLTTYAEYQTVGGGQNTHWMWKEAKVTLAAETTMYLNIQTQSTGIFALRIFGGRARTVVIAEEI